MGAGMRDDRRGLVDAPEAGLLHTETQIDVLKVHEVPLVEPAQALKDVVPDEQARPGKPAGVATPRFPGAVPKIAAGPGLDSQTLAKSAWPTPVRMDGNDRADA
jgi:hypothetical protein